MPTSPRDSSLAFTQETVSRRPYAETRPSARLSVEHCGSLVGKPHDGVASIYLFVPRRRNVRRNILVAPRFWS